MVEVFAKQTERELPAYQELFQLGCGGMGTVHLARAVGAGGFERLVVIKRMHAHLLSHREASQRFLHEAHTASKLHHANVVGIHQVGRDDRGYFLVLDFVEGGSLENLVDRSALKGECLDVPVVLRIALDALRGLQAAHEAVDSDGSSLGILHRDVSLQNILVGTDGVARVADFGIAKSAISSVSTDEAHLVGKLLYIPPEHLRKEPPSPSFDIYSTGVTMWLALTGKDPWPVADESQILRHILDDGLPPPSSSGVVIAPQIEALVMRACSRDLRERYESVRQMREDIDRIARDTGWLATHNEVAEVVQRLMGTDLARQRTRVRGSLEFGPTSQDCRASTGTRTTPDTNTIPKRTSPAVMLGLLVASIILVGVGAWWLISSSHSAMNIASSATPATPATPASPVTPLEKEVQKSVLETSHTQPSTSTSTHPPDLSEDGGDARAFPIPPTNAVPTTPKVTPIRPPTPSDTTEIVKKNPYRK